MAQAEVARGELQRLSREDVSGPGARVARPEDRIDPGAPVDGDLRPDHRGVGRRARGIVAARHLHLDVAVTFVREVLLKRLQRLRGLHVRHQAQVELGDGLVREDGFAARTRVTADQSLDVDRRLRDQSLQRFEKAGVVGPAGHPELLLQDPLVHALGSLGDHRLLRRAQGTDSVHESGDRGSVPVGGDERVQGLDQMPGGAVHARLVARVNVQARTPAPLLARRGQLDLDDPLGAQCHHDGPVEALRGGRHEDSAALGQGRLDVGSADDLRKVRGADLLLPLGHEDQVDGELPVRAPEGVQRREEGGFRALLVDGAASDDDLADARLLHDRGVPRGRGPLGRIHLLDVVHEVERQSAGSSGVEDREDSGLPVGWHSLGAGEARVLQELNHELAALRHPAVLRRDRGLVDPLLETLDRFVVALLHLREHGREAGISGRRRSHPSRDRESGGAGGGALEESSSVHAGSLSGAGRDPGAGGASLSPTARGARTGACGHLPCRRGGR